MNKVLGWLEDWGAIVFSVAILAFVGFVGSPQPVEDNHEIVIGADHEQYLLEQGYCIYKEGSLGYEKYVCSHNKDVLIVLDKGTYKLFN